MGSWISSSISKEYKIIYILYQNEHYPLKWPDSYVDLLMELKTQFNFSPKDAKTHPNGIGSLLIFDGTEKMVRICSEQTFQGLVPSHKINRNIGEKDTNNQNNRMDVYYVLTGIGRFKNPASDDYVFN